MDITKIKFEDKKTVITYTENIDMTIDKETVYKTDSERHPDFDEKANTFLPFCLAMLDLPKEYLEGVTFRGVTLSFNDHQGMGAVVTMLKDLPEFNAPLVINTPHCHNAEEGNSIMPHNLKMALEDLLKEAKQFLKGKRKQEDMFKEAA